jgi:hypothetical protein
MPPGIRVLLKSTSENKLEALIVRVVVAVDHIQAARELRERHEEVRAETERSQRAGAVKRASVRAVAATEFAVAPVPKVGCAALSAEKYTSKGSCIVKRSGRIFKQPD